MVGPLTNNIERKHFKCHSILHEKALPHLAKRAKGFRGYILPFRQANLVLSWLFRLNKRETWIFLKEMASIGLIEIIPNRGIKVLVEEVVGDE